MGNQNEIIKELTILLVDDDEFIVDAMYHLLRRRAKQVDTALNGQEALALFRNNTYDLVISDIEMPEMNGYELHAAIARENPDMKFIFLSGHDTTEIEERFQNLMIAKPIDKEKLLSKIVELV